MKSLLRVDASINQGHSISKKLANTFQSYWLDSNQESNIVMRDLANNQIPHLDQKVLAAFYGGNREDEVLKISNTLIDELKVADEILISTPVFNFAVPSNLKAYVDNIVRVNETFVYDNVSHERSGLLQNKKATIVVARGGYPINGNPPDEVESYLVKVLNYMGITKVNVFTAYGTTLPNAIDYYNTANQEIENYFNLQNQ